MADDWVAMRVALPHDPKVSDMADFLAGRQRFRDEFFVSGTPENFPMQRFHRHAMRALCIVGLLKVWAMGNERGIFDCNDVILEMCSLGSLDAMADIPDFGLAMEKVHWAIEERETGIDVSRVRLPNFLDYNQTRRDREDRQERVREGNRERQRRFRERKRNADVTGASRVTNHGLTRPTEQNRTDTATAITADAQLIDLDRGVQGGKTGDRKFPAVEISGEPPPENFSRAQIPAPKTKLKKTEPPKPQKKFLAVPPPALFGPVLDELVSILNLAGREDFADQIGFIAKLAYADAAGHAWPSPIWDYAGRAKKANSPAAWLTDVLRKEAGEEAWKFFEQNFPTPAHCQWLLRQLAAEDGRVAS